MSAETTAAYGKIVVAFDGSDGADAALRRAATLAAESDAILTVVYCTGRFQREPRAVAIEPDPAASEAALASMRKALAGKGLPDSELRVVDGNPPAAILAVAEEVGAELIVTGSRGPALMPQAVLGRVSSTLVSNAPCDVLVVQPDAR